MQLTIDGVGPVQVDDAFAKLPAEQQAATVEEIVAHHAQMSQQPSIMDRIAASPVGRLVHDNVVKPAEELADLVPSVPLTGSKGVIEKGVSTAEGAYNDALSRNRNTPGYANARAQAEAAPAVPSSADLISSLAGGKPKPTSGAGDQLLASFAPGMAGLAGLAGGLDQSNANADVQAERQAAYAKENPKTASLANFVGGMAEGVPEKAALPAMAAATKVPTIKELRDGASALYKQVENSGINVSTDAMNRLGDTLQDKLGSTFADPDTAALYPKARAAYSVLAKYATDGAKATDAVGFSKLDELRRLTQDATGSIDKADRMKAYQVLDHLDDFVNGLKPTDLDTSKLDAIRSSVQDATSRMGQHAKTMRQIEQTSPGALISKGAAGQQTRDTYMAAHDAFQQAAGDRQAALADFKGEHDLVNQGPQATIDALNQARNMWSRKSKAETIQSKIDAVFKQGGQSMFSMSGAENALRNQFRKIAQNERAMARFTPDEQAAISRVASGGDRFSMNNIMRDIGKFAPTGFLTGMGEGSLFAAHPSLATAALPVAGAAGRVGATVMTKAAANRALDLMLLGKKLPQVTEQAALQLPRLTAQSRPPIGLFGTLPLMQQQAQPVQ